MAMYIKRGSEIKYMEAKKEIKTFDIWWVDLGDTPRGIQGGKRPCVIVSNNIGNMFASIYMVMPLTTVIKKEWQPTHAVIYRDEVNHLLSDSMLLAEQMRVVSEGVIDEKLGALSDDDINKVESVYSAQLTGLRKNKEIA